MATPRASGPIPAKRFAHPSGFSAHLVHERVARIALGVIGGHAAGDEEGGPAGRVDPRRTGWSDPPAGQLERAGRIQPRHVEPAVLGPHGPDTVLTAQRERDVVDLGSVERGQASLPLERTAPVEDRHLPAARGEEQERGEARATPVAQSTPRAERSASMSARLATSSAGSFTG